VLVELQFKVERGKICITLYITMTMSLYHEYEDKPIGVLTGFEFMVCGIESRQGKEWSLLNNLLVHLNTVLYKMLC
jgi:hypothetical protein